MVYLVKIAYLFTRVGLERMGSCVTRWICLLCAALLLFWLPAAAHAETADVPDSVRQSVVHLYAIGTDDEGTAVSRWTGTGFAVGIAGESSDVFLTNWHVVTGNGEFDGDHVRIWLLKDKAVLNPQKIPLPEYALECRILAATDGFPDVAVIQTLEPASYPALPLLSSRRVKDGTPVYALMFPGLKGSRNGADSGPEDVVVTAGEVRSHLRLTRGGNASALIHTAALRHGSSGGPLVNGDGAVIGLNTYGFEEDVSSELFCALYIDYGMKLLDSLGISYTSLSGPSKITVFVANTLHLPGIRDTAAWILLGVGICIFTAFLLYFCKSCANFYKSLLDKFRPRNKNL